MTMAHVTAALGGAAAQIRRNLEKEEEQMTQYGADEIEEWEFKIVRAATRKFKDPAFVRQVCEEEARSGWDLLEKFDDCRIRFKRKIEHRKNDHHRDSDPYRTVVGMSGTRLELYIAAGVVGCTLIALAVAFIVGAIR